MARDAFMNFPCRKTLGDSTVETRFGGGLAEIDTDVDARLQPVAADWSVGRQLGHIRLGSSV